MGNVIAMPKPFDAKLAKFKYDDWLHIPPGKYEATFQTWVTYRFRTQAKIVLMFSIVDMGEYFGVHMPAFFNVKRHKGKTRERGGFIASSRGDLITLFYRLNPTSPKVRLDRVPLSKLQQSLFTIQVQDVTINYKREELPKQMHYSRITEIELI